jgi:hypothetical protein
MLAEERELLGQKQNSITDSTASSKDISLYVPASFDPKVQWG